MMRSTGAVTLLSMLVLGLVMSAQASDPSQDKITSLPGLDMSTVNFNMYSGYFPVNETYGSNLFYFFAEASEVDPKTAPVVLWLTGGPGCSSELAIFYENGPFHLVKGSNNITLSANPWSWNRVANVLYVDQPVGTGFSYLTDEAGYVTNEDEMGAQLHKLLVQFLSNYGYTQNNFFVFGESYAGHYVPKICSTILNNQKSSPINLKGCAVGNGMTDAKIQYGDYGNFAYGHGLIDYEVKVQTDKQYQQCLQDINAGDMNAAAQDCNEIVNIIQQYAGNFNVYDVRKTCNDPLCYDFSAASEYLSQESVQMALHTSNLSSWAMCNNTVYAKIINDWFVSQAGSVVQILEAGIPFMAYNGMDGFICNNLGVENLLRELQWSGQQGYVDSTRTVWRDSNKNIIGYYKTYKQLSMVGIKAAGHMVPMDQPEHSFEMYSNFLSGPQLNMGF